MSSHVAAVASATGTVFAAVVVFSIVSMYKYDFARRKALIRRYIEAHLSLIQFAENECYVYQKKRIAFRSKSSREKNIIQKYVEQPSNTKGIYNRICALEASLKEHGIFLVLLVDEFHFVYKADPSIGKPVISELFHIVGANEGCIHCIVSGSSSILRRLVFATYHGPAATYPSYGRVDLNSTKLQPYWIYPMRKASDFRAYCERVCMPADGRIAERYLYSGGRPGLVKEMFNLGDVPYSMLSSKGAFICDLLPDVLESTVRNKLWNKNQNISDIEEVLNNLSDGTSYQPCENNKRRGRPARIVENDDSAKLLYNSLKTGCGLPAAADILNTSRRINGLDYISFSAISSFCSNSTVIEKSTRLTKKSGKSDPNSDWAKARVVQSDQLLKQLGCKPFELGENFRPINLHALVFWDEKHKEQALGSESKYEYRIRSSADGTPDATGELPAKQERTSLKYPKEGRACFGAAMRMRQDDTLEGVKCLPFNYSD
eukprot:gene29706-38837_t